MDVLQKAFQKPKDHPRPPTRQECSALPGKLSGLICKHRPPNQTRNQKPNSLEEQRHGTPTQTHRKWITRHKKPQRPSHPNHPRAHSTPENTSRSDDKANKTPYTPNNQPRTHSPEQPAAHDTPTSPENKPGTPRATLSSRTSTTHLDPSQYPNICTWQTI